MRKIQGFLSSGLWLLVMLTGLYGCAGMTDPALARYQAVVDSADRSNEDRKSDERRFPSQLLAFTGVTSGMKVLDMGAGAGYSTELLARAVAPNGVVYGQFANNNANFDKRFAQSPVKNVSKLVRPSEDPIPLDAGPVDLVTMFLTYHDITYSTTDRPRMLKNLFAALKPGGHLVIIDHAATPGSPISVGKTLHRLDEALLKSEVEAAGFKLVSSSDFLRYPADPRTEPHFKMSGRTDQFALRFLRP
jgi:predicted methyltransferase